MTNSKFHKPFLPIFLCACVCTFLGVQFSATTSLAARTPTAPDLSDEKNPDVPPTADELERAKIVNISAPPPIQRQQVEADAYYYKFRNSMTIRAGPEWLTSNLQNPGLTFSVLYAYPLNDLRGVEAGADLSSDGNGTLHFTRRQVIGNERFRWFHKYGVGVRVVGSDQLVTFLRLRNWQARLGGGFELSTMDPVSFRVDVEALFSTEAMKALVTAGASFAW